MKIKKILPLLLLLTACNGGGVNNDVKDFNWDKEATSDQFNFAGNYTPPELRIDGIKDEEQWSNATSKLFFGSLNQCSVELYRGENALFCFFEVDDQDIQTVGNNNGDDVTHGDSVEIYFDFKNDAAMKPQNDDIQINIGAHGKTRIFVGSNGTWGSWNGLLDYEINLNGTLNDDKDEDKGYTIELMVPYAQVGIDKNSKFGVAVGHVARGKDSTHDSLQYTWGGLVHEGTFVDPQCPNGYLVCIGNELYSRNNVPVGKVNVNGVIYDQNGNPLSGAKVVIGEEEATTDNNGKYVINNVSADNNVTLTLSKEGYKTYTRTVYSRELKSDNGRVSLDCCLIQENSNRTTKIKGVVKNPVEGLMSNALIKVGNNETTTLNDGTFEMDVVVDYDLSVTLTKENYKESVSKLNTLDLVKNTSIDLGVLSLYSPASIANFGGNRGITAVEVEIYRGFEGINFLFKTNKNVTNGDHIELFIDSGSSFHGRDTSDYRIDFKGDGGISIVNFGEGTNNIVSKSGITNNPYLEGTTYYIEALVPYAFLGVSEKDIIGVSFGMWSGSLNDWDGWDYEGYVAPEYSDQYCRIGLDNGLYRAISNNVQMTKVYGSILDGNNNPITSALVNGNLVNNDGSYSLYVENNKDVTLTVSCAGYVTKVVNISASELTGNAKRLDITLSLAEAVISGTCNVDGVKIYLKSNPSIVTYSANGTYSITVPTNAHARLIFEKEGYKTIEKAIAMNSLTAAANANVPFVYDVIMEME